MSSPLDTQSTLANAQSNDLLARQKQLRALSNGGQDGKAKADGKLREACKGFESVFVQKMWEQMRATIPEGGYLKGKEEKFWQSMYDQELAKKMTDAGGIGLADMMYEQLSKGLADASKSTSQGTGRTPLNVKNVPLLPEKPAVAVASASTTISSTATSTPAGANAMGTPVSGTNADTGMYSGEAVQPLAAETGGQAAGVIGTASLAQNANPNTANNTTNNAMYVDIVDAPHGENAAQTMAVISNTPPPMPAIETQTPEAVRRYLEQLKIQTERNVPVTAGQTPLAMNAAVSNPMPATVVSPLAPVTEAVRPVSAPLFASSVSTQLPKVTIPERKGAYNPLMKSTLPPISTSELQAAINPPPPEKPLIRRR